jgi:hypothetical protein
MKKIFGIISFMVVLVCCTTAPKKISENNNLENTVFSDTGIVSFQNNEYLLIGILIDDYQKALDIWSVPDSQGFPKISSITKIKRNKPITIFLVYSTKKSVINMTYNYKMFRSDGTFSKNVYNGLEIAKGNSPDNLMYKASQLPTIVFDETDKFGKYQFHISVFDNNTLIQNLILEFNLIE